MSSLLNKSAVKKFILEKCTSLRPAMGMNRVSKEVVDYYEAVLREKIVEHVKRHPSIGKTFHT